MKRTAILMFFLFLLFLAACSDRGVIPRAKMAEINADLFLVDEWFSQNQRYAAATDTSLVYEQVFQKYGYTGEDYVRSLDYYMLDSDRYIKVVKKSRQILEQRKNSVVKLILADDSERRAGFVLDSLIEALPPVGYFPYITDTTEILIVDSLGNVEIMTDTVFFMNDTTKYVFLPEIADSLKIKRSVTEL